MEAKNTFPNLMLKCPVSFPAVLKKKNIRIFFSSKSISSHLQDKLLLNTIFEQPSMRYVNCYFSSKINKSLFRAHLAQLENWFDATYIGQLLNSEI